MIVRVLVSSIEVVPPFASPELAGGALALVRAYSQVFSLGLQLAGGGAPAPGPAAAPAAPA